MVIFTPIIYIFKPMKWRSNRFMRLQRAGDDENPAEKQIGKWTTEGEAKGESRVSETYVGVNGRVCDCTSVKEGPVRIN